jgi:hypothetical protein
MTARSIIIQMKLDRRKSHDGNTRVKLDARLNEMFFDKLICHWIDQELQACAGDLRVVRDKMTARRQRARGPGRAAKSLDNGEIEAAVILRSNG